MIYKSRPNSAFKNKVKGVNEERKVNPLQHLKNSVKSANFIFGIHELFSRISEDPRYKDDAKNRFKEILNNFIYLRKRMIKRAINDSMNIIIKFYKTQHIKQVTIKAD